MKQFKQYVGIDNAVNGGTTDIGKLIREARAYGILPESKTCNGFTSQVSDESWEKVQKAWRPHGFQVDNLSAEIRERYWRIQTAAMECAVTLAGIPRRS